MLEAILKGIYFMKSYHKDNNRYMIFNVDHDNDCVHFLWGKFDFLLSFGKQGTPAESHGAVFVNTHGECFSVKKLEWLFQNHQVRVPSYSAFPVVAL